MAFTQSEAVFNDPGNDYNFRIESDTRTHMFFVDAGQDTVSVNRESGTGTFNIKRLTSGPSIFLYNSNNNYPAGSTGYSDIDAGFYDYLTGGDYAGGTARVRFESANAGAAARSARVLIMASPADGSNTAREMARFQPDMITFNDLTYDQDFRIESLNYSSMFYVEAGTDRVGVGTGAGMGSTLSVLLVLRVIPTRLRHSVLVMTARCLRLVRRTQTVQEGSQTWSHGASYASAITFGNVNNGRVQSRTGASIYTSDVTTYGRANLNFATKGTSDDADPVRRMSLLIAGGFRYYNATGNGTVWNEDGVDADFVIESNNDSNMLFVDGGNDKVIIGGNSSSTGAGSLHVRAEATTLPSYNIKGVAAGGYGANGNTTFAAYGSVRGMLHLGGNYTAGTTDITNIKMLYAPRSTSDENVATIASIYSNNTTTDSTSGGNLTFTTRPTGGASTLDRVTFYHTAGVVFNEGSLDYDFRVESDNNDHMLYVDASADKVSVGSGGPQGVFNVIHTLNNSSDWWTNTKNAIYLQNLSTAGHTVVKFNNTTNYNASVVFNSTSSSGFQLFDRTSVEERLGVDSNELVINEGSQNFDFRVESDGNTHAIMVDAGNNDVIFFKGAAIDDTATGVDIRDTGQLTATTSTAGRILLLNGQGVTSCDAIQFKIANTEVGSVEISTTGTTYNTTSDRRLKTDIQPIADATDKLMAMNPVTHKWIAEPEADAVHGFIAQEMQEIVPEAVSGDPDGEEMMSMDYGRITPVLVAALQDAHNKITALEKRLAEMETK